MPTACHPPTHTEEEKKRHTLGADELTSERQAPKPTLFPLPLPSCAQHAREKKRKDFGP